MKSSLPRRQFLQAGGLALSAIGASNSVSLTQGTVNRHGSRSLRHHRCRHGRIGPAQNCHELPGVECVGAADLCDGHHLLAKQITGNPNLFTTRNYTTSLTAKILIASSPPSRISGTNKSSSIAVTPAKMCIARSQCLTPQPKASK